MKIISGVSALLILAASTNLHAAPHCGELDPPGSYGPYDYTDPDDKATKLPIVEQHHFGPDVEKLIRGSTGLVGADLSYTLIAFPNHYRALAAMGNLSLKEKTPKPKGARYSIQCYFDRAIRFKPNDTAVRVIYSNLLLKMGKPNDALEQLKEAIDIQPENPAINYNLGLLYMQKKDYEQARTYAKKAYELGFPLPGLKNQLTQAGKWED